LFLGSLLLRVGISLAGFYLIGRGDWEKLLVSLLGFVTARLLVTRLTRAAQRPTYLEQAASHAP
jgi:F1F0 ATPase subunit 2